MATTALEDGQRFLYLHPWVSQGEDPVALVEALVQEASVYKRQIEILRQQLSMAHERADQATRKVQRLEAVLATLVHQRKLSRKRFQEAIRGDDAGKPIGPSQR